jgi:mRNA interferase RelE/StbE
VSDEEAGYWLRVTDPAGRQLSKMSEGTAAAIVEFFVGALMDSPHRLGWPLQRELARMRSARRGAYRIVYEIEETDRLAIVYRIEHRSTAYRLR